MDYVALQAELTAGHPVTGAYSANNATAAVEINAVNRTSNIEVLTGDQLFSATDSTDFGNLTTEKRDLWVSFCGKETIDPFGTANIEFVTWIFGGGSTTITALQALRLKGISRATELELENVNEGHIIEVRSR